MSTPERDCHMVSIASTHNGRVLKCSGHHGFLLEFGPIVIRLKEKELEEIGNMVDQLVASVDTPCVGCTDKNCRAQNFALDIFSPRVMVEFYADELPELQELLVEARLTLLLKRNQIGRSVQD